MHEGTYGEIFMFRLVGLANLRGLSSTFMGFFIVLPIIMVGVALSKWKVVERANVMKGRIVVWSQGLTLAIGIWVKSLPAYRGTHHADKSDATR